MIGVGVAIAAVALPAAAGARVGHFVGHFETGSSHTAEFSIRASNGYSISVAGAIGHPEQVPRVNLTARNRDGAEVTYLAPGVATEKRIEASFGALGRISVRFHPDGPPHFAQRAENCRGRGELVHDGSFVGTIEFEGEQAYTTLHASRANGKVTKSFKEVCSEGRESRGAHYPAIHLTSLEARSSGLGSQNLMPPSGYPSLARAETAAFVALARRSSKYNRLYSRGVYRRWSFSG